MFNKTIQYIHDQLKQEVFAAEFEDEKELPDGASRYCIKVTLTPEDMHVMWDEYVEFRMNPQESEYLQFEGTGTVFEIRRKDEILEEVLKWIQGKIKRQEHFEKERRR